MFQNGSQVSKDIVVNSITTKNTGTIPIADPSTLAPLAGGLTYDPAIEELFYGNGTTWVQVEQGTVSNIAQGAGITCTPNPIVDTGIVTLSDTPVTPGTYGDATNVSQVTVDQKGRITNAVDIAIPPPPDTPVIPGTYGDVSNIGQFTVDQKGRITGALNIPLPVGGGIELVYAAKLLGGTYSTGDFQPSWNPTPVYESGAISVTLLSQLLTINTAGNYLFSLNFNAVPSGVGTARVAWTKPGPGNDIMYCSFPLIATNPSGGSCHNVVWNQIAGVTYNIYGDHTAPLMTIQPLTNIVIFKIA
jgi:hypothetical protein